MVPRPIEKDSNHSLLFSSFTVSLLVDLLDGKSMHFVRQSWVRSPKCTGWRQSNFGKKGGQLTLHHLGPPLILHKELQAQGIAGKLPHSRAPMFQQISTLCGVLSNVCQSL
jgi:hypothetical protein